MDKYYSRDKSRANEIDGIKRKRRLDSNRKARDNYIYQTQTKHRRSRKSGHDSTLFQRLFADVVIIAIVMFLILLFTRRITNRGDSNGEETVGRIRIAEENNIEKVEPLTENNISEQDNLLMLVNKDHAIPENYIVNEHWLENKRVSVADEMYDALCAMLTAGTEEGKKFVVASGYRSAELQRQLLEEDIRRDMQEYGLTWQAAYSRETMETMPPGHSEHETGLAVDLVAFDYQLLDDEQVNTEENKWLLEHCQDYGFILRYPKDKEDVTGISYEPWHFRYVGIEAAKEITERGITLEEYLAL